MTAVSDFVVRPIASATFDGPGPLELRGAISVSQNEPGADIPHLVNDSSCAMSMVMITDR